MPSYVIVGASQGLGVSQLPFPFPNTYTNGSANSPPPPENTIIGLVRTPSKVQARLSADNLPNVHLLQADMADHTSLTTAAAATSKLTPNGAVDYLIINGVYVNSEENFLPPTAFSGKEDLITTALLESIKVNVLGVIFSINAFLPLVRKSSKKKIAVISTGLADLEEAQKGGIAFTVSYSSSKAALNMVIARFAVELRGEGVVVLALMSPEVQQQIGVMLADFKRMDPNFPGRPISMEESIKGQKKVIEEVTIEQSGAFLSHHGDKKWL
ncbi:hypothetical protein B7463_g5405, partial [Scytalidium lignicola]